MQISLHSLYLIEPAEQRDWVRTSLMSHFWSVGRCRRSRSFVPHFVRDRSLNGLLARAPRSLSVLPARDASSERRNETCHIIALCDASTRARFKVLSPPAKEGAERGSGSASELPISLAMAASVTRRLFATHPVGGLEYIKLP